MWGGGRTVGKKVGQEGSLRVSRGRGGGQRSGGGGGRWGWG